jgi:hypothetical protein
MARRRWWPFSKINWFWLPAATFNVFRAWNEAGPIWALVLTVAGLGVAAALEYRARRRSDATVAYWRAFTNHDEGRP